MRKARLWWLILPLAALCLAALGLILCSYRCTDGGCVRKDASSLDFSNTKLSSLNELADCTSLTSLSLCNTEVTDLTPLIGLSSLKEVDARNCPLTVEAAAAFLDARPDCVLLWSVPLGENSVDSNIETLTAALDEDALLLVPRLTGLKSADLSGSTCCAALAALPTQLPACTFTWTVPLGGAIYPKDAESITVSNEDAASISAAFECLPALKTADLCGCALTNEETLELETSFPNVAVCCLLKAGDETWRSYAGSIAYTGSDAAALRTILPRFSALCTVELGVCKFSFDELSALISEDPTIAFSYSLPLGTQNIDGDAETLRLTEAVDIDALTAAIPLLPKLEFVDICDAKLDDASEKALATSFPNIHFRFILYLGELPISTDVKDLDLSATKISAPAVLDEILPYLYALQSADLCGCGLDNGQMEQLQSAYPCVQFVWMVQLGPHTLRTDATAFSTFNRSKHISAVDSPAVAEAKRRTYRLTDDDLTALQYCTELMALDLGHNNIVDASVLKNCTKLQYLILADNLLTDISFMASLPELIYLELFMNPITDLSPLSGLSNLKDLNLCDCDVEDFSPLFSITSLERLWYLDNPGAETQEALINASLPNCCCTCHSDGCTGSGWREHERYFTLRRILLETVS